MILYNEGFFKIRDGIENDQFNTTELKPIYEILKMDFERKFKADKDLSFYLEMKLKALNQN